MQSLFQLFIKNSGTLTIFTIVALVFTASCTNNKEDQTEVIEAEITSITVKETAITGDDVSVEVSFYGRNGCSEPYDIKATKVGQTISLRAYYSSPTDNSICTEILPVHKLTYTYFADMGGIYFFASSKNGNIIDTLQVY